MGSLSQHTGSPCAQSLFAAVDSPIDLAVGKKMRGQFTTDFELEISFGRFLCARGVSVLSGRGKANH